MRPVLISTLSLMMATTALACVFVWSGASGDASAVSADAGDGYYITEFRRTAR